MIQHTPKTRWAITWSDWETVSKEAKRKGWDGENGSALDYTNSDAHYKIEYCTSFNQAKSRAIEILSKELDSFGSVDIREQIFLREKMHDGSWLETWEFIWEDAEHYTLDDLQGTTLSKAEGR